MIIGHLPAAYILSTHLHHRLGTVSGNSTRLIAAGMLGGIFPDFDLLYFYFIDQRQHHHHEYWSHYPLLWLLLLSAAFILWRLKRGNELSAVLLLFTLNAFIHLCLDTPLGSIEWLAPFSHLSFTFYSPSAHFAIWWLNFIFSPPFLIELVLLGWALRLYRRQSSPGLFRSALVRLQRAYRPLINKVLM